MVLIADMLQQVPRTCKDPCHRTLSSCSVHLDPFSRSSIFLLSLCSRDQKVASLDEQLLYRRQRSRLQGRPYPTGKHEIVEDLNRVRYSGELKTSFRSGGCVSLLYHHELSP